MYICYADDSGDDISTSISCILIPESKWSAFMQSWLTARQEIKTKFGIDKNAELHASKLLKARGRYASKDAPNAYISPENRELAFSYMISAIASSESVHTHTIVTNTGSAPLAYENFLLWLNAWAISVDQHVIVFYDGKDGSNLEDDNNPSQIHAELEMAYRSARPYKLAHRKLDISNRRILEDVIMQDSKSSQLIQAADLVASCGLNFSRRNNPGWWKNPEKAIPVAASAHQLLSGTWIYSSQSGIQLTN